MTSSQLPPLAHDGGWMERREGKLKKTWRSHFYAMESSCLVEYFDAIGTSHTSRFFPFSKLTDVLIVEDANHFTFSLRCDHRLYVFRVASAAAQQDWVAKLRRASISSSAPPPTTPRSRSASAANATPNHHHPLNNNSLISALQVCDEDGAHVDPDTNSEDSSSSSGSEDEDEDDTPLSATPAARWDQRVRRFLSLSKEDSAMACAAETPAAAPPVPPPTAAAAPPAAPFDIRTVQLVEYDVVEVFENQRWFPITGWSTKLMKHDRAWITNRHGHNRVHFYRASTKTNEEDNAFEATLGDEDAAELPGGQVHVIKGRWHWHTPTWHVLPLAGLPPSAAATPGSPQSSLLPPPQTQPPLPPPLAVSSSAAANSSPPPPSSSRHSLNSMLKRGVGLLSPSSSAASSSTTTPTAAGAQVSFALAAADEPVSDGGGWSVGVDFPDFDASVARGVGINYPVAISLIRQVRTRRLVRVRRRTISVTARLPEHDYFPLFPAILSFQRQVVCEGWLGFRMRRQWRSKYCKLIRYCDGVWDGNGLGRGLVQSRPSSLHLVAFECKETHQKDALGKSILLLPSSSARMTSHALLQQQPGSEPSTSSSLALYKHRFAPLQQEDEGEGDSGGALATALALSPPQPLEPRCGRFEVFVDHKRHFLFSADTRADCQVWVRCLNEYIGELGGGESSAAGQGEHDGGGGEEDDEAEIDTTALVSSPRASTAATPRRLLKRLTARKSSILPQASSSSASSPHAASASTSPQNASASASASALHGIELVSPEPYPSACAMPACVLNNLSQDGKLKEWVDYELPHVTVKHFFTAFYQDQAKYSTAYFHHESGDINIKCTPWARGCALRGKDEFDFADCEEHARERMITFQMHTGSSIAPLTRVEMHQRYYYYNPGGGAEEEDVFVLRSTSHSLDIPFGDSFLVIEKWVVHPLANGGGIRVRIYCDAVFSKPPFGFILHQIKKNCNLQIPKALCAFRDKSIVVLAQQQKQQQVGAGGGAVAKEEEEEQVVVVPREVTEKTRGERDWVPRAVGYAALAIWLAAVTWLLFRLVVAVELLAAGRVAI